MSSVVHYKFKSSKTFETLKFEGISITKGEFLRRIVTDKKLTKDVDDEIRVYHAQSNEGKGIPVCCAIIPRICR